MPDDLLVLAPGGRDAAVVVDQLESAGITSCITTPDGLIAAIRDSELGAAIITAEALDLLDIEALRAALLAQPAWSDCPILLLTRRDFVAGNRRTAIVELGNVTLLERPLHPDTLVTAARTALRARARQRRAEAQLQAREEAEAQVRNLAATLEARVIARTFELTEEMAKRASAEERLRNSEELYRYTIDLSAQIPWSMSADGVPLTVGERWSELTGLTLEEFVAHGWADVAHPDDLETNKTARADALATRSPYDVEFRVRTRDGSYRWCWSRGSPRFDANGDILRWYGTIEDIDDRRQAEARNHQLQSELIHVSRLSAMGTMASTLAHELNQPLTAIANYVRGSRRLLLASNRDEMPAVLEALAAADSSAVRAGEIVRRLRELVASGDVQKRPEDLANLVREAHGIALIDAASLGIECHMDLDLLAARVDADRIQVQQILINLLRNAVEALTPMAVRRIDVVTRRVGDFCEISVADSGPGMLPEVAARLFEPFNTSKTDGMGIGLSISRTIVEAHGGQIWHEPRVGGGTVMHFTLPAV